MPFSFKVHHSARSAGDPVCPTSDPGCRCLAGVVREFLEVFKLQHRPAEPGKYPCWLCVSPTTGSAAACSQPVLPLPLLKGLDFPKPGHILHYPRCFSPTRLYSDARSEPSRETPHASRLLTLIRVKTQKHEPSLSSTPTEEQTFTNRSGSPCPQ